MDGEMFTNEPVWGAGPRYAADDTADLKHKTLITLRRVLLVSLVFLVIMCVYYGLDIVSTLQKSESTTEGLQYIGPVMNSVRGDLENNQDSLAEQALASQRRVTDMGAAQQFTSRERLTTPEEELMKKMKRD